MESNCDTRKLPVLLQGPGLMSHTPALLTVEIHLDPRRPDISLTDLRVSVKIKKRKDTGAETQMCPSTAQPICSLYPLLPSWSDKSDRRVKYSSMSWSRAWLLARRVTGASLLISWALVFFLVE